MKKILWAFALSLLLVSCGESDTPTSNTPESSDTLETATDTPEQAENSDDSENEENLEESENPQDSPENNPEESQENQESTEEAPESTETQEESDKFAVLLQGFTLEGEMLDPSIFSDYDLTLVNIWATWCGPCVNEMPYLQEVYEQLPSGVNFITICQDGNQEKALALEILSASGATFHTLTTNEALNQDLMVYIQSFPTTLFVDKEGNLLTLIEGAPPSQVTDSYLDMIAQVLEMIEE